MSGIPSSASLAACVHFQTCESAGAYQWLLIAVGPDELPFKDISNTKHQSYGILQHASLAQNHAHNMLETLPALYSR